MSGQPAIGEGADPAPVVWITGLSGAGKTTLAQALCASLQADGLAPALLDGDEFREAVGDGLGHSAADRLAGARRLSRFAAMLSRQGVLTVVATVSLFREVHEWNRRHLPRYCEVYLAAPPEFLARRDAKGLYAARAAGGGGPMVGVDQAFDAPANADLVIDASAETALPVLVARIRGRLDPLLPISARHAHHSTAA